MKKPKILLISDDVRLPSGVGVMSQALVYGTADRFDWVQLAAAKSNPFAGQVLDWGPDPDGPKAKLYGWNGYGSFQEVKVLLEAEKPDALAIFTDPRFFVNNVFAHSDEIRRQVPILYYNIWDDLPAPLWNRPFYQSCDMLACISKQTYGLVNQVVPEKAADIYYVPHGADETVYRPYTTDEDQARVTDLRYKLFGSASEWPDYVVLWVNRNVRRKMPADVLAAWKVAWEALPDDRRAKTALILHTDPVDVDGTNLPTIIRDLGIPGRILFTREFQPVEMADLYNLADVTVNIASNEGFGLATLESIASGTPIIVNVTGGLQDQVGFQDNQGRNLTAGDYAKGPWASNHDGRFRKCGPWAFPIWPSTRSIMGSPATPYIMDDRADWQRLAAKLLEVYALGRTERKRRGALGAAFVRDPAVGMTAKEMGRRWGDAVDITLAKWKPAPRYRLVGGKFTPKVDIRPTYQLTQAWEDYFAKVRASYENPKPERSA